MSSILCKKRNLRPGSSLFSLSFSSFYPFMSTTSNTSTTSTEKMISACAGALVTSLLVTPMDVIKLRLQTQQSQPTNLKTTLGNVCCQLTNTTSRLRELPTCIWMNAAPPKQQTLNLQDCLYGTSRPSLIFKGTLVCLPLSRV